jgi:hypothetical protein
MLASEPFNPDLQMKDILRPRMRSRELTKTEFTASKKPPNTDCQSLRATLSQAAIDTLHKMNSKQRNTDRLYFKSASLTVKRDRYSAAPPVVS